MQRIATALPDVFLIEPKVITDQRGFFLESYHREKYAALGIHDEFVQDNHSQSVRVLQGLGRLHAQLGHGLEE